MTLLDQLRILRIPGFLKTLLGVLALALVALNAYVIMRGLADQRYDFWVAAGASLLAAAVPGLAVFAVLAVTESGVDALKRRMQTMLVVELPAELRFAFETPPPPLSSARKVEAMRRRPNPAQVTVGLYRDELWADYRIAARAPDGGQFARMRVELILRRVNVNLVFDRAFAARRFNVEPGAPLEAFGAAFQSAFKHTVHGAEGAGYVFNMHPIVRRHDAMEDLVFVASRTIDPEFIWDPAARLEFMQDLVLMLRAFATEGPAAFQLEQTK